MTFIQKIVRQNIKDNRYKLYFILNQISVDVSKKTNKF